MNINHNPVELISLNNYMVHTTKENITMNESSVSIYKGNLFMQYD